MTAHQSYETETLHRLIYYSRQRIRPEELKRTVEDILVVSMKNNAAANVSGLLLAHQGWFLQVLEGPALNVQTTLGRIVCDPRHRDSKVISAGPVDEREFGAWAMCAPKLTAADDEILTTLDVRGRFRPETLTRMTALNLLLAVQRVRTQALPRSPTTKTGDGVTAVGALPL